MKATPLDDDFCVAIDDGKVLPPGTGDKKKQARFLADNFGWGKDFSALSTSSTLSHTLRSNHRSEGGTQDLEFRSRD